MFILSLDTGYVQIEQNEKGGYDLIEYEGGTVCKLKIGRHNKDVHIIPIGQIVTDRYNKNLQSYMDAGGTVEEVLQVHQTGKIKIAHPYVPIWLYPKKKPAEESITNMDFADMPYVKVCYIQFMGKLTPMFAVDNLSELYFYDLFRMKTAGVLIRECADCGRAFIAKTTAVRCSDCRKAGLGEKKKRANIKNDPARQLIYKIKDRNKNGKRNTSIAYQTYYANLCYVIQTHTENDSPEDLLEYAKMLDSQDKRYFKLCKFFDTDCYNENLINEWNVVKSKFPADIENLEQWIEQWYEKAGLTK